MKGYTGCEPCEELKATILEAERCAKLAAQMTAAKHRGNTGSGKVTEVGEKRMHVDDLVKFLEEVESLPCKVPEANILQVRDFVKPLYDGLGGFFIPIDVRVGSVE